ncbi:MAG: leucine-rich repeat domain-containing protein [Treponema sp.]|nr:leucine-rich repeat domain-containing protein [Treponema sp.]
MNKKSIIFSILFLITVFIINAEERASQPFNNESDFVVEIIGDSSALQITGYNGTRADVNIPKQIRRMTVVAIGERAFYKYGFKSVTIPINVILIGRQAFLENEITRITIGTNVTMFDDSFDFGFAGFYIENGRRAGTYIFSDGKWNMQTVTASANIEDIPAVTTAPVKAPNSFFMEPYGGFSISLNLWDYGPSSLLPRSGMHFGFITNIGNLTIGLAGEGGGFFGITYPYFEDIGITYGFYFGSFLEIYFSDFFGFSIGGGMSRGYFNTKNDMIENYFFPFAELNIMIGDEDESLGIFFRYYFNDADNFYNKFSIGIKRRVF